MSKIYDTNHRNKKLVQKRMGEWKNAENKITKLDSKPVNVLQGNKTLTFEIIFSAGQKLFASLPHRNNLQTYQF